MTAHPFDRPYDRSETVSIGYPIAYAIAPKIGCDRPSIGLCSIPLIPPERSKRLARAFHPHSDWAALVLRSNRNALDRDQQRGKAVAQTNDQLHVNPSPCGICSPAVKDLIAQALVLATAAAIAASEQPGAKLLVIASLAECPPARHTDSPMRSFVCVVGGRHPTNKTHQRTRQRRDGGMANPMRFPMCSQGSVTRLIPPTNTVLGHMSADQRAAPEGIYGRSEATEREGNVPARARETLAKRTVCEWPQLPGIAMGPPFRSKGVGGNPPLALIFDIPSLVRAGFPPLLCSSLQQDRGLW